MGSILNSKLIKILNNLLDLSSKSKESIEEAILKLVEETGELSSNYLKEKNPDNMLEEACDIIQASFKLAYIIQQQYPELDILDKMLLKNKKWREYLDDK